MFNDFVKGNLDFMTEKDDAQIKDRRLLSTIATLLSVNSSDAEKALCSRVVAARGDVVEKGHTLEQARYGRDAFSKVHESHLAATLDIDVIVYC